LSIRNNSSIPHREIPVLITVDVCDGAYEPGERKSRFKHLMDTLPEIQDVLKNVINAGGGGMLPVTWFVRADSQVAEFTGDAAGLMRGWSKFWQEARDLGGEIGWHPHLYKREEQVWKPIRDPKRLASEADRIWREITASGWRPVSSRIGESVCSTELMAFLDSAGIKADSTALPGRSRDDGIRWFDWGNTPGLPYFPAKADYRRPPESRGSGDRIDGEEPMSILEVPFTMASTRAPYDGKESSARKVRRYIDLSYDPARLRQGLAPMFKDMKYLVAVIHPLQAVGREVPEGGLIIGGLDTLRANIRMILESIELAGRSPKALTLSAFRALWLGLISSTAEQNGAVSEIEEKPSKTKKREGKYDKKKGGSLMSKFEGEKAVRGSSTSKPSARGGSPPRRGGPRKRKG
jgi:hypothetical protein